MRSIDPNTNNERDNYKLLIGSIVPRPIAFVTSVSEAGVMNGAPFSYFNIVSSNPPMISLAIQRSERGEKDTARNIYANKEFVVHIVDEQNIEQVNEAATSLPPEESEIELANFTPVPSSKIAIPGVKEAKIRMECTLEHSLELGDLASPSTDLLIGKIVQFHVDEDLYEDGRIDPQGLAAVSRLAGINYATIGDIFEMERPK